MISADLNIILPEIVLAVFAMLGLLGAVYTGKDKTAGLLVWLVGWTRFKETLVLFQLSFLAYAYITTLSRSGARQQWAIEDRQRETRDGRPEQAS